MEEYKPEPITDPERIANILEGEEDNPLIEDIDALRKMKPNQFYFINGYRIDLYRKGTDLMNTDIFHKVIENLRNEGFDIGNDENSQYGWRMPLPKKRDSIRKMMIFRRY
jgi:hypothetical protein